MKIRSLIVAVAAVLAFAAAYVNTANAQTVQLAITGSSALYNELGSAAWKELGCVAFSSGKINLYDTRFGGVGAGALDDTGTLWVAWTNPGGTNGCAGAIGSGTVIDYFISVDSVVGNRCYFANPACTVQTAAFTAATFGTGACPVATTCSPINQAALNFILGTSINVAATDIRPEDADFAMVRGLTPCGVPLSSGSQYLGLGYNTGSTYLGTGITGTTATVGGFALKGGGPFNVGGFNIVGNDPVKGAGFPVAGGASWVVTPVGAAPVVVFVNPKDPSGMGLLSVSNVDRATLSGILDGTYGNVLDLAPQTYASAGPVGINVMLREPLSGTYNTMEYAIPDNIENQSSQDIGDAAVLANTNGNPFPPYHCTGNSLASPYATGTGPTWGLANNGATTDGGGSANPLQETNTHNPTGTAFNSTRNRAIGTGNEVANVLGSEDSLGYAFWSAANFQNALPGNAKYLTVDGIDPIQENWSDGEVPTANNDLLSNVSFTHVKDGSYPIWSLLRLVSSSTLVGGTCTAPTGAVTTLVCDAQSFVSPNAPDFALVSQLAIVRSHFAPPSQYVNFQTCPHQAANTPCNGDLTSPNNVEYGGDVGGLVYTQQADGDYNADTQLGTGNTGHRQ